MKREANVNKNKRSMLRRVGCSLLMAAMALGTLTGCGKSKEEKEIEKLQKELMKEADAAGYGDELREFQNVLTEEYNRDQAAPNNTDGPDFSWLTQTTMGHWFSSENFHFFVPVPVAGMNTRNTNRGNTEHYVLGYPSIHIGDYPNLDQKLMDPNTGMHPRQYGLYRIWFWSEDKVTEGSLFKEKPLNEITDEEISEVESLNTIKLSEFDMSPEKHIVKKEDVAFMFQRGVNPDEECQYLMAINIFYPAPENSENTLCLKCCVEALPESKHKSSDVYTYPEQYQEALNAYFDVLEDGIVVMAKQ